jgi:hypothetical protein
MLNIFSVVFTLIEGDGLAEVLLLSRLRHKGLLVHNQGLAVVGA